jgi:long-chain acyl-CoA synthetase
MLAAFRATVARSPDGVAIRYFDGVLSFAFVVGLLAGWKAAGIAVAVNPMNKARELDTC